MIGFAMTGSHCTLSLALECLGSLTRRGYEVQPIMSENVYSTDTRFFRSEALRARVEEITGRKIIHTVRDAEPLGPKTQLDCMLLCPCTGNTLAKLAHGITDTAVTMATKAVLRCGHKTVIALASNDALGANLENIGKLYNRKNIFFVPLSQDDCINKPYSLVCDFSLVEKTLTLALQNKQIQPFLK